MLLHPCSIKQHSEKFYEHLKSKWFAALALMIAVGVFAAFDFGRTPSPQYYTSSVERGDIHDVVEATGTINAVTTVQVGSQVSGAIAKLADEPTGNLDSRTAVEIMQIFQDLNQQGLTIVLVTHEPDIANFAQRIVIFRDGKIRRDDAVQNRPRAADVLLKMPTLED